MSDMRIIVAALGSYGDVHPFLAIGRELRRRGHEVIMIMPAMYESLTRKLGLEFAGAGTVEQFDQFSSQRELWDPVKGLVSSPAALVNRCRGFMSRSCEIIGRGEPGW